MKLKISPTTAIERGRYCKDSLDIELCGHQELARIDESYSGLIASKQITDKNHFTNIFDFDSKFLYSISLFSGGQLVKYENGLGHLVSNNDKTFLTRIIHFYSVENNQEPVRTSKPMPFACEEYETIVVSTYLPVNILDVLCDDNNVVVSSSPYIPTSVHLSKDTILGRLSGDTEALPLDHPVLQKSTIDTITQYTKQLILKSSKFCVKHVVTDTVQLNPTNDVPEKRGTLRYNEAHNAIEFYNGTTWKSFITEDRP
jgi:hypothetical protein